MTDHEPRLRLHDTRTREKRDFEPLDPSCVRMYVCGPTVYGYAHIGNARPAVVFDVLFRLLEALYPRVIYARNITDIDDKILKVAKDEGVGIEVVSRRYAEAYREDMDALGVLPPTIEPWATEHVADMIGLVERLLESGHAYRADGHVMFSVESFDRYGELSGRTTEELLAGARVEVAEYKKNPADFVLWKPSTPDQAGWDSPFGRGRPGWHLECSSMIEKHLGTTIDIHGGGTDLVFPHHENENAQSRCVHGGAAFVRYWLHNGFLSIDHQKMSKSLGNILTVRDLRERIPPEAIRFILLRTHYRAPLEWNDEVVEDGIRSLERLYGALRDLEGIEASHATPRSTVVEALEDDLNTPRAISELYQIAKETHQAGADLPRLKGELLASAKLLGLLSEPAETFFQQRSSGGVDAERIEALIAERAQARRNKDWSRADQIRDELDAMGVLLEDKDGTTRWRIQR